MNILKLKLKEQENNIFIFILTAVVTIAYFALFLMSAIWRFTPEPRYLGDLQLVGFPAFVQTGKYFAALTHYDLDFFTANGPSSWFNR